MFAVGLMILRYIFLFLLFLFIFRLVKWMVGDLQGGQRWQPVAGRPEGELLPEGATGRLVVTESQLPEFKPGDSFMVGREISIGRGAKSDILIMDSFASTQHARVYLKDGQYWLEDLMSMNGTFLNDVQIGKPVVLAHGDRLKIGNITFQFVRWGYEVGAGN